MTDYFDNWFFTTEKTSQTCPTNYFKCAAPHACARDPTTGRSYCCDSGATAVCWTGSTPCQGDGSTMACGSGQTNWCCLANGKEKCTQTRNQINICWSTGYDTLRNISVASLEAVHASLASKNPEASSLMFTPTAIIAATRTDIISTSTSQTTSKSPVSSTTTDNGNPATATSTAGSAEGATAGGGSGHSTSGSSTSSLSPGAIAGLVVGIVAALTIIGVMGFLLWRRMVRKEADANAATKAQSSDTSELPSNGGQAFSPHSNASELPIGYSHIAEHGGAVHEKAHDGGNNNREYYKIRETSLSEMAATPYSDARPAEMPTWYNTASELPTEPYHRDGDDERTPFTPQSKN